jgi:hypothetical protein
MAPRIPTVSRIAADRVARPTPGHPQFPSFEVFPT